MNNNKYLYLAVGAVAGAIMISSASVIIENFVDFIWIAITIISLIFVGGIFLVLNFKSVIINVLVKQISKKINPIQENSIKTITGLKKLDSRQVSKGLEGLKDTVLEVYLNHLGFKNIYLALQLVFIIFGTTLGYVFITKQNKLIEAQNRRIDQQIYLQEAERRSGFVQLFGNVMDALDHELKSDYGQDSVRNLSPQLIGRIVALSQRLEPYKYLEGDNLSAEFYSPERGQLLTNLLKSNLSSETIKEIFEQGNFQYSVVSGVKFDSISFDWTNLSFSKFEDVEIKYFSCLHCTLNEVDFNFGLHTKFNLQFSNVKNSKLRFTYGGKFMVTGGDITNSIIRANNNWSKYGSAVDLELERCRLNSIEIYGDYNLVSFNKSEINKIDLSFYPERVSINGTSFILNDQSGYSYSKVYVNVLEEENQNLFNIDSFNFIYVTDFALDYVREALSYDVDENSKYTRFDLGKTKENNDSDKKISAFLYADMNFAKSSRNEQYFNFFEDMYINSPYDLRDRVREIIAENMGDDEFKYLMGSLNYRHDPKLDYDYQNIQNFYSLLKYVKSISTKHDGMMKSYLIKVLHDHRYLSKRIQGGDFQKITIEQHFQELEEIISDEMKVKYCAIFDEFMYVLPILLSGDEAETINLYGKILL